jgi:hypothetical protein
VEISIFLKQRISVIGLTNNVSEYLQDLLGVVGSGNNTRRWNRNAEIQAI